MDQLNKDFSYAMLLRQLAAALQRLADVISSDMELDSLDALLAAVEQSVEGCSRTYDLVLDSQSHGGSGGTGGASPQAALEPPSRLEPADVTHTRRPERTPYEHPNTEETVDEPPEDWQADFDASIDALVGT